MPIPTPGSRDSEAVRPAALPAPPRPHGLRRISPQMIAAGILLGATPAEEPAPAGTKHPKQTPGGVLAAFKAAAPFLGFSRTLVHAIDWLFAFTQAQDWAPDSEPVVWPSAGLQQHALGLGPTQTKTLNRHMAELGLLTMKDSPNGKRYGRRDPRGRIIEAYGFNLAPLAIRQAEFEAVAAEGRAERERIHKLKRRATIARKSVQQLTETATEIGAYDEHWQALLSETLSADRSILRLTEAGAIEGIVLRLEASAEAARATLEKRLQAVEASAPISVDSDPKGPQDRPHQYNYNPASNPQEDTVGASGESRPAASEPSPVAAVATEARQPATVPPIAESAMRLTAGELTRLAPRLKPYIPSPTPSWPEIIDAADWLRHEMGISQHIWADACQVLGRDAAAVAIAIVSTKPASHFVSSPGGYFHAMIQRAKNGRLDLARSIWGLRKALEAGGNRPATAAREADPKAGGALLPHQ